MEWLQTRLTQEGFGHRSITGSMTAKQRSTAIDAFSKDPPTTVFLLSMRSGAGEWLLVVEVVGGKGRDLLTAVLCAPLIFRMFNLRA